MLLFFPVVGAKLISPMEVERYYGAKMQDDAVVARKKRIELFKPNLPLISLLSRRSSSTAMRHHDSSELSKDVGCMRLSDQAVKGENYFFKPISSNVFRVNQDFLSRLYSASLNCLLLSSLLHFNLKSADN